jgi:uroporphyrinogen decarboxylase
MVADDEARIVRALEGRTPDRTPIWFMRQAGRYLPEYRQLRERYSILEIIRNAELSAKVTLQPLNRFDVDAAVIFADILPPLAAMGLDVEFVKGDGPVIRNPIARTYDVDMLAVPPSRESLGSTLEAIGIVATELAQRHVPVVGFAGAPFTLASYAIEGGTSRTFTKTKAFMYGEPAAWKRLMTKLATFQIDYLKAQVAAGAKVLQLFDSWAGLALGREEYREMVLPYNRSIFSALEPLEVPLINFSTGTGAYIDVVADSCGSAVGVDWRLPIDEYRRRLGDSRPLQGNLDPAVLLAPWPEVRYRTDELMQRASTIGGHVFNLGHGVLPETNPDTIARLVEYVHEWRGPYVER